MYYWNTKSGVDLLFYASIAKSNSTSKKYYSLDASNDLCNSIRSLE